MPAPRVDYRRAFARVHDQTERSLVGRDGAQDAPPRHVQDAYPSTRGGDTKLCGIGD